MSNEENKPIDSLPFGRLLKFWRGVHQLNQEELAHRLASSPRHISRLENGRVQPSKAMVEGIARELALGERDSNHLLIAAGFNPVVRKVDFNALSWRQRKFSRANSSIRSINCYRHWATTSRF